jgi:hypothetical protein
VSHTGSRTHADRNRPTVPSQVSGYIHTHGAGRCPERAQTSKNWAMKASGLRRRSAGRMQRFTSPAPSAVRRPPSPVLHDRTQQTIDAPPALRGWPRGWPAGCRGSRRLSGPRPRPKSMALWNVVRAPDTAPADDVVQPGQAACRYSWMTPPSRSRRRMSRSAMCRGSVIDAGTARTCETEVKGNVAGLSRTQQAIARLARRLFEGRPARPADLSDVLLTGTVLSLPRATRHNRLSGG